MIRQQAERVPHGKCALDVLFNDTLKDIYFAEKTILKTLPKLAKAAHSGVLKGAFEKHHRETQGHVDRLEQVFATIDKTPQAKTCDAIVGITDEGAEIMDEYKGSPALDVRLSTAVKLLSRMQAKPPATWRKPRPSR
jgi:ferritin-like metal-binding protein YciE